MRFMPLNARLRTVLLVACCACAAGCSGLGGLTGPDNPAQLRAGAQQVEKARDAIAIGKSTKADVQAALGKAIAVPFDSGYEVWVYRWGGSERNTRAATELVVLFAPNGMVKKVRVRPTSPQ